MIERNEDRRQNVERRQLDKAAGVAAERAKLASAIRATCERDDWTTHADGTVQRAWTVR